MDNDAEKRRATKSKLLFVNLCGPVRAEQPERSPNSALFVSIGAVVLFLREEYFK